MGTDYFNNYSRVKPGHINFPRMLRNFKQKTDQVRPLVWHSPTKFVSDGYGVESATVARRMMEVPEVLAKVQPITTKDFQLAKEGKWITGAAKIYIPSMEWLYKYYNLGTTSAAWINNYEMLQTNYNNEASTSSLQSNYVIDGLMDNVFYDNESTVLDFQPTIEKSGSTSWNATTDYSTYLGADFTPFTQDATNSCLVTSDNNSITITISGTSNSDTEGTVWWNTGGAWPPIDIASRFSFEYYNVSGTSMGSNAGIRTMTPTICVGDADGTYPYLKYGSTGSNIDDSLGTTGRHDEGGAYDQWQKFDLPWNQAGILANSVAADTASGSRYTTSVHVGMGSWTKEDATESGQTWGNSFSCLRDTPNTGSLNGSASWLWTPVLRYMNVYFGFRFKTSTLLAEQTNTIKLRNMKWYRAIPWSVHSVKELADYQVLNCVRDDGQSLNQQIAQGEVTTL